MGVMCTIFSESYSASLLEVSSCQWVYVQSSVVLEEVSLLDRRVSGSTI